MEIETGQQSYRVRIAFLIMAFTLLESILLRQFSRSGASMPVISNIFMVVSLGSCLFFWVTLKRGSNLRWGQKELLPLQMAVTIAIQYGFIFLAPKLSILFLLVLLVIFAILMLHATVWQFVAGCVAYSVATGLALSNIGERFSYPGESPIQLTLLWLFFTLALAAFWFARIYCNRLLEQLSDTKNELKAALARIEELGSHNPLTGALNRRALIQALETELLRVKRTGHPFCFVMLDLDHFSAINEKFGSENGDAILKKIAEVSIKLLRAIDRFGHMDGEEFGIVLPATWLDQGMIAIGRLRKAVDACDWSTLEPGLAITFSAGITTNAANDTAEVIIKRASEALAQAKLDGCNRTVQVEEALPDMLPGMD